MVVHSGLGLEGAFQPSTLALDEVLSEIERVGGVGGDLHVSLFRGSRLSQLRCPGQHSPGSRPDTLLDLGPEGIVTGDLFFNDGVGRHILSSQAFSLLGPRRGKLDHVPL